jgi:glycosyltransferase involved in cell wall biosynthesis
LHHARIFVNGLHAKVGGGKSILNNYLSLLNERKPPQTYVVLTPDKNEYNRYSSANLEIIEVPGPYTKQTFLPFLYRFVLPKIIRQNRIDVILNFGDVVIPSEMPQLHCFDWPYAVYPESLAWKRLDPPGYVSRKAKLFMFKRYLHHASRVITQSKTIDDRLRSLYGLRNTVIVPNAVSLENVRGGSRRDFQLPRTKRKLLYLTHYYPHKNLEILIPLAKRIKQNSLPFCLITTVSPDQHKKARLFLSEVNDNGLRDTIINLGPISMAHVPALYEQSDGLLMPTLLESFSGAYVEAMFHKKAILTSHFDFALDVCGDGAFYFDPLDVDSILGAMTNAFTDKDVYERKVRIGSDRLSTMLTWEQVFNRYQEILATEIARGCPSQ